MSGTGTDRRNGSRTPRFGHTELPDEVHRALREAVRLEWISIAFLSVTVTLVFLVLGSSQAMRAAWAEDLLSFLPPISFLIATHVIHRRPSENHPYGFHRAVGVAHLVSAVALLVMGSYLLVDSTLKLIEAEHPTIGGISLLGHTVWLGWPMITVLALTIVPPVLLGRAKLKRAKVLHDKVLYADADMNKADWMTAAAAIAGILGIGLGLWWADAAAAMVISLSIAKDGVSNLKGALGGLVDARARTYDNKDPHPLIDEIDAALTKIPWVAQAKSRVRDQGHVFHVESFVVPREGKVPTLEQLDAARAHAASLDWKVRDLVLVPCAELPEEMLPGVSHGGGER